MQHISNAPGVAEETEKPAARALKLKKAIPGGTMEDPRKVAAREKFMAEQRLIDAEDALAIAKANLSEKTKTFDTLRGAGKRA